MGESARGSYARQIRLPGWGAAGQEKLTNASALVVGVGGLGCPVLEALARAGVGALTFCDPDRVEASNLARQTLFTPADVGRPKVEAAAERLAAVNPAVTLHPRDVRVDETNVRALVEAADVVIDGADLFSTKFLVHDACRSAGKPLVSASAHQWEARLQAFPFHLGRPGCWRCLYPQAPADDCVGTCADDGVAGPLVSAVGQLQALTALRLLLGLDVETCSTLVFDADEWAPRAFRYEPDPSCACSRGAGDWSWLNTRQQKERPMAITEFRWNELTTEQRQTIVDVREAFEIQPGEWEFFEAQGSEVEHFPFTRWQFERPEWRDGRTYLIVCAHGVRSANALKLVPRGVKALSLTGGVAGLDL